MVFSLSSVYCLGALSVFLPVEWLTHGASTAGSAWQYCAVRQVQHCAVDCLSLSLSRCSCDLGPRVKRKERERRLAPGPRDRGKRGKQRGTEADDSETTASVW
jgi:hypothetical protein